MADPLIVEVPTADLARALMQRLHSFPTELDDDTCRVRVTLVGNPDRAVTEVLHSLDEWLVEHGLARVRVQLDDRTYTLNRPQPS